MMVDWPVDKGVAKVAFSFKTLALTELLPIDSTVPVSSFTKTFEALIGTSKINDAIEDVELLMIVYVSEADT
jgi:hypothetical protein